MTNQYLVTWTHASYRGDRHPVSGELRHEKDFLEFDTKKEAYAYVALLKTDAINENITLYKMV